MKFFYVTRFLAMRMKKKMQAKKLPLSKMHTFCTKSCINASKKKFHHFFHHVVGWRVEGLSLNFLFCNLHLQTFLDSNSRLSPFQTRQYSDLISSSLGLHLLVSASRLGLPHFLSSGSGIFLSNRTPICDPGRACSNNSRSASTMASQLC